MKIVSLTLLLLSSIIAFGQSPETPFAIGPDSLLRILNSYRTDTIQPLSPEVFAQPKNVDDRVRQRLLALVKNEWTEAEMRRVVDRFFRHDFELLYLEGILRMAGERYHRKDYVFDSVNNAVYKTAMAELKKDPAVMKAGIAESVARGRAAEEAHALSATYTVRYDSVYRVIYDSVARLFRKRRAEELRAMPVPDEIVLSAAVARLREVAPILKSSLASASGLYSRTTAELALAGLGDTAARREVFLRHRQYVAKPTWDLEDMRRDLVALALIVRSPESITLLTDWMDTTRTYRAFSENNDPTAPSLFYSSHYVRWLLAITHNGEFSSGFMKRSPPGQPAGYYDEFSITGEQITFIRKWLLANKDKIASL